jgi:NAD(P)-dependent dehydrogenase (short-subunit alcohol dehydrogenase family)
MRHPLRPAAGIDTVSDLAPDPPAADPSGSSQQPSRWRAWQGRALVVGHGGIGRQLLRELRRRAPGLDLVATSRQVDASSSGTAGALLLPLELTDDASIAALAHRLAEGPPLRIVLHTAGLLHEGDLQPEKRLSQVRRANLERSFAVNAFAPLLLARAIEPLIPRDLPSHFACLSARVGSIGDNALGGWYSYRAAKAAQNQLLRCLAIEWGRRLPRACVSLLHPGTTATPLSEPFRASVLPGRLFTPERAARQLLDVLEPLGPRDSGGFWAWDGQPIPW